MKRLEWAARYALALLAAAPAGVIAFLGCVQVTKFAPPWISFSVAAAAAAAVWMAVGLAIAVRHVASGVALLAAGIALVWYVTRGIVHSESPHAGLHEIAMACAGASLAWTIIEWRRASGTRKRVTIGLPAIAILLTAFVALATPPQGMMRTLTRADSTVMRVPVTYTGINAMPTIYLTLSEREYASLGTRDMPIRIELDPGSGDGVFTFADVTDGAERGVVCAAAREATERILDGEIANGITPSFMKWLSFRSPTCDQRIVRLVDANAAASAPVLAPVDTAARPR